MFKRFGTPGKLKVVATCNKCGQPRPLITVTVKGKKVSMCAECANNVQPS